MLCLGGHRALASEEVNDFSPICIETDYGLDVMSQIDTFVQDVSSKMQKSVLSKNEQYCIAYSST